MDRLDWEYDKGGVIWRGIVYASVAAVLLIAAGFLLHVGWAMYEPG